MSKTIVIGVTGSIAAYKAADIVSQLRQRGHEIFVVMTPGAKNFITPLTLQTLSRHPVLDNLSEEEASGSWHPGHIELADRAELLLVALATRAPLLIAPAMNGKMWDHPATQENVLRLRERGAEFIGPASGMLACGYEGSGRLIESSAIVDRVENLFSKK